MKKFKKFLAILLVASMIFTTNSVSILAEGQANESESYESRDDQQEEILDKNGSEEENSESLADEEAEPEEDTESKKESFEEEAEEAEEEEETETVESASEEEEQSESESDAEETSEEASGKELNENKKGSDGLYGTAENPFLYIYYVDNMYTPNDKDGHVQKMTVTYTDLTQYFGNPNNPFTPFYGMLQEITNQVPDKMTLKGFHLVSDQNITDEWPQQDEIFEDFKQNYTHDASVDYANAASIQWDGTHDMVLYTVYDSISFNIKYLDVDDDYKVQTIKFDDTQEEDLRNFIQEQFDKGINKCLALETDEAINGYTGEEENIDYKNIDYMEVKYMEWAQNPNSTVWYGLFYYIPKYFNVIYIADQNDFIAKKNSFKTYTVNNVQSDFQGNNGDIYKYYEKRSNGTIGHDPDIFFDTKHIEEIENFEQSNLETLVNDQSICLGKEDAIGPSGIGELDDKFEAWRNGGYPTKSVCWVIKYAAAYKWYAVNSPGAANENHLDAVRRMSMGVNYSESYFKDYNELYPRINGNNFPNEKKAKGFKIVPYTDIPEASRADTRKYYLQEYYFKDTHIDDTDLKSLDEFEAIYKTWTESNDDIYNGYAAFLVYEPAPKELQSIGFGTYPTKMTYFEGETFNPAGLVLTLVFNNGYPNESLAYAGNEDKITFELPSSDDALTTALARDGNNDTVAITVKYGGCSNTFNLTVNEVPKAIDSISIVTEPTKSYIEGQTFDPANLVIKVKYEDNSEENITYNNTTQNNFSFTLPSGDDALTTQLTTGSPTVTVGYMGKTTPLALTVAAKQVTGIDITTEPKKSYDAGDKFDPSGLVINVTYDNGTDENIEYDNNKNDFSFEIDGSPVTVNTVLNTAGDYDVKVKYKGQEDSYQMNVRTIDRIEGVNNGKTTYYEGFPYNPAGLSFKVIYTNNDEETIEYDVLPDGITFNPSITTLLKTSDTKVTVSYKGFSYDINLTVNPDTRVVTDVEITTEQNKKEYEQGQSFNGTGMVIHVTYEDLSYEDIPYNSSFTFDPSVLNDIGDDIEVGVIYKGVPSSNKVTVKVKQKTTPNNPSKPSYSPSNNGGSSGSGGSSDSSSSDPTKGPMGDVSKNPTKDSGSKIPENKLFVNQQLMSYYDTNDSTIFNARDVDSNLGYGRWLQIEKTPTWYFLTYDFDLQKATKPLGFLANGWYKVGWEGLDKWYYYNDVGVMQRGWITTGGKTYYLQEDLNDNWYGGMLTGVQYINGVKYIFDENGALIGQ